MDKALFANATFTDNTMSQKQATGWGAGVDRWLTSALRWELEWSQTEFKRGLASCSQLAAEKVLLSRVQLAF